MYERMVIITLVPIDKLDMFLINGCTERMDIITRDGQTTLYGVETWALTQWWIKGEGCADWAAARGPPQYFRAPKLRIYDKNMIHLY
jgi:hypothetical protein